MAGKCVRVAHINIKSLLPKLFDLNEYIFVNNIDILAVGETWLSAYIDTSFVNLNDFNFFRCDRQSRGGGVGVYVSKRYQVNVLDTGDSIEQLWLTILMNNHRVIVGVVYKPPKHNCRAFLDELENSLDMAFSITDNVICCGDININLLDSHNTVTQNFSEIVESLNLKQIIDQPTRLTSLLDVIVCSDSLDITNSGVIHCDFSDHDAVFCDIPIETVKVNMRLHTYRDFKGIDLTKFNSDLYTLPLHLIFSIDDVNCKIDFLNGCLLDLFNTHSPLLTRRITKKHIPWLTDNVKLMIKLRDKAKNRYRRSGVAAHWDYYKSLRNLTTASLLREKRAYFNFISNTKSSKMLWKQISYLEIGRRSTDLPVNLANVELINDYFINSVSQLNIQELLFTRDEESIVDFSFSFVDPTLISNIVLNIHTSSMGVDGINLEMIKFCLPFLIPYITHIINCCIEQSVVPDVWKCALVKPLSKVKNPLTFNDLRPISILPTFSKILEKVIYLQLNEFISANTILPSIQSGFRCGYSCETALLAVTDDIIAATDNRLVTALVLLDFSKAFDSVSHNTLCSLLHYLGLAPSSVQLIKNYLTDRRQYVAIDHEVSSSRQLVMGVPQGSILGPLLFSIYTSQFVHYIQFCKVHLYADDMQLYLSFKPDNWQLALERINSDLQSLYNIASQYNLKLNPGKTQVILFGNPGVCERLGNVFNVTICNTSIPVVNSVKNLGFLMDNTFRYRNQINKYIKNAYMNLRKLYPHRASLTYNIKTKLCEALVLSQFTYCSTIYHSAIDSITCSRIQKVQNSCLRYIFGIRKYERISYKLKTVGWLNMKNRRELKMLTAFHKIMLNKTPPYLYEKIRFRTDVHNVTTRFRGLISPPPFRLSLFRRCFSHNIYKKYNDIHETFKVLSASTFKSRLKSIYFSNQ